FALVLLGASVLAVPIARRLRLSPIVAYLAAGVIIGPWGIGIIRAPSLLLGLAELGIVLMMFVIGLELELSRLIAMRRDIFGLGAARAHRRGDRRARVRLPPDDGARRRDRRPCARAFRHRGRAGDSRRPRRPASRLRPARLRHPAVPGHGRGAADRAASPACA